MSTIPRLIAAVSILAVTACGVIENTESPTRSSPNISEDWLIGAWTTGQQTRQAWDTAFHGNGGDPAQRFDIGRGMTTSGADILSFTSVEWTESQQSDHEQMILGSQGTYTRDGVKLRLTEHGYPDYNFELVGSGDSVRLRWIRSTNSDPVALTLFTAFPFHRIT